MYATEKLLLPSNEQVPTATTAFKVSPTSN